MRKNIIILPEGLSTITVAQTHEIHDSGIAVGTIQENNPDGSSENFIWSHKGALVKAERFLSIPDESGRPQLSHDSIYLGFINKELQGAGVIKKLGLAGYIGMAHDVRKKIAARNEAKETITTIVEKIYMSLGD